MAAWRTSSSTPATSSPGSTRPTVTVLENISLSFYPGAKIGVIGSNGAGKSQPAADHGRPRRRLHRRGPPDPRLQRRLPGPGAPARPGQGRPRQRHGRRRRRAVDHRPVQRGHGDVGRARRRLREDRCAAGRARGQDRGRRRLEPRAQRRDRHGRAALPARRRRRHHAVGWRAPPRGAVPPAAQPPRPAAARRADQPPRRRERRLARAVPPGATPGTVVAITHDRYFLDNVAQWILELDRGKGFPFEGNYTSWLEQKQERLNREKRTSDEARRRTLERELEWVRHGPQGPPGQGQGPPRRLRQAAGRGRGRPWRRPCASRSPSRRARAWATR